MAAKTKKVPAKVFYDGDYDTIAQAGPPLYFLNDETQSLMCKVTWQQRWVTQDVVLWDSMYSNPGGPKLYSVESTPTRAALADIVEWDVIYAAIPGPMLSAESAVYPYQFLQETQNGGGSTEYTVLEAPIPAARCILWEYFFTANPQEISLSPGFRYLQLTQNVIFQIGTPPQIGQQWFQGDPQTLNRWKGHIWRRETRVVPVFTLQSLGSQNGNALAIG